MGDLVSGMGYFVTAEDASLVNSVGQFDYRKERRDEGAGRFDNRGGHSTPTEVSASAVDFSLIADNRKCVMRGSD